MAADVEGLAGVVACFGEVNQQGGCVGPGQAGGSVELMLNAVNLTFVAFARRFGDTAGQVLVFFVLVVAAAEVAVGLAIIVAILRRQPDANADDISLLKG